MTIWVVTAVTVAVVVSGGGVWWRYRRQAKRVRQVARVRAVLSGWMPDHPSVADLTARIAYERHVEHCYGRHALTAGPEPAPISSPARSRRPVSAVPELLSGDAFTSLAERWSA